MKFKVDDVIIQNGEKHRGWLQITKASTHTVKLPYIIINGEKEGPTLTVLAGVHALECAPVEAVYRLAGDIEPKQISGTLILVPILNTEGFHTRKPYANILDHLNQNKVFPGDPERTITSQVAYRVFESFVSKSDTLIDAHSADLGEDVTRGIYVYKTENKELFNKMVDLASCYHPALIETTSISGNTGEAVNIYGIPCLMVESGTPYPIRESDIQYHYDGIVNVMKRLDMLDGKPITTNPAVDPVITRLYAKTGGVWRRKVEAGQRVKKGEYLGSVCNLLGDKVQTAIAPFDGVVSFLRVHYSVNGGDTLLLIAKV